LRLSLLMRTPVCVIEAVVLPRSSRDLLRVICFQDHSAMLPAGKK
jgi:hypothetical protein